MRHTLEFSHENTGKTESTELRCHRNRRNMTVPVGPSALRLSQDVAHDAASSVFLDNTKIRPSRNVRGVKWQVVLGGGKGGRRRRVTLIPPRYEVNALTVSVRASRLVGENL